MPRQRPSIVSALVIVLLCGASAPAEAAKWWGWLDKLSGPGPFEPDTILPDFTIVTLKVNDEGEKDPLVRRWFNRPDSRQLYLVLELSDWKSNPRPDFQLPVDLQFYNAVFYVSPARLGHCAADCRSRLLSAFDVGVGIGIARLSGDGVKDSNGEQDGSFRRAAVPFRLKFTPAELFPAEKRGTALHRSVSTLSYSVGTTLMTGTFDGTRFVAPPNYHSSNPFLGYRSFTIDVTALISTNK